MAHGLLYGMASRDIVLCFFLAALLYSSFGQTMPKAEVQPEFLAFLENHTVTQGRDVSFTCVVNHLQSYKVAWIKSDSRAILAIHTRMVAHNHRLSVTHNGHNTWKLHVTNVQPNDSGTYMCQVNTDPMRSQTGHMKVVIPPDIMDLDDSADNLTANENSDLRLRCCATGTPKPMVTWRREDGRNITLRTERGNQQVKSYEGEHLHLTRILRQDMGSYLCIASNGVPPSVSKRHYVKVRFKPLIKVPNQLIAAPANTDVVLHCYLESSPKGLSSWYTDDGTKLLSDEKHELSEAPLNDYAYQLNLTIKRLNRKDFGMYTCSAENSFGKAEGTIRLQEMHLTKTTVEPIHRDNGWRKRGEKKGNANSYVAERARPGFPAKSNVNVGQTTPMSRRNSSNVLTDINPKKSKVSSYPAPAPEPAYFPPTQLDIQSGAESPLNFRSDYIGLTLAVLVVVTCN